MEQTQPITYPVATSDGFVFENDSDEAMGIETTTHENGNKVKRIRLSDGSIAMVRELKGSDVAKADRLHNGEEGKFMPAMCSLATKVNNEPIVMEDLMEMKARDYNKIRAACAELNF